MPASSSTVHNTSDQKITSDAHDGATRQRQHRRRPCRLIHSLRLPDEQRHRRGTTLIYAAPVGEYGTTRIPRASSIGAPGPASPTSGCICTRRLCTARIYGHTHGWTSRAAGEEVDSRDGLGDKRTEGAQACSGTEWYCVEQRVGCGGVDILLSCSRDRYVW